MNYIIDIQHAYSSPLPVDDELIKSWACEALSTCYEAAELTIRLVESDEIRELNRAYRHQDKTTNVLAFPAHIPDDIELDYPLLGDIIICPSVLDEESRELAQFLHAHWAHIVIHGVLHLCGYDHMRDEDEIIMQQREIEILARLGFDDPYDIVKVGYNLE